MSLAELTVGDSNHDADEIFAQHHGSLDLCLGQAPTGERLPTRIVVHEFIDREVGRSEAGIGPAPGLHQPVAPVEHEDAVAARIDIEPAAIEKSADTAGGGPLEVDALGDLGDRHPGWVLLQRHHRSVVVLDEEERDAAAGDVRIGGARHHHPVGEDKWLGAGAGGHAGHLIDELKALVVVDPEIAITEDHTAAAATTKVLRAGDLTAFGTHGQNRTEIRAGAEIDLAQTIGVVGQEQPISPNDGIHNHVCRLLDGNRPDSAANGRAEVRRFESAGESAGETDRAGQTGNDRDEMSHDRKIQASGKTQMV